MWQGPVTQAFGGRECVDAADVARASGPLIFVPPAREHVGSRVLGVYRPEHAADRREQVDAFYSAAREAGGRDNGPQGPRPQYSECYGAFVLDPDSHNIEAVHHGR